MPNSILTFATFVSNKYIHLPHFWDIPKNNNMLLLSWEFYILGYFCWKLLIIFNKKVWNQLEALITDFEVFRNKAVRTLKYPFAACG
jgi:hypothetical protein